MSDGIPGIDRPLRVFHLPVNVASVMSGNVAGLREIGVEAKGLAVGTRGAVDDAGLRVIDIRARPGTVRWFRKRAIIQQAFLEGLAWADVVHWYFDAHVLPFSFDIARVGSMRLPAVIQLLGSDARDPDVERADNPWYARVWDEGYEYRDYESAVRSRRLQSSCARAGFAFAPNTGLVQYVRPEYRDRVTVVERPVPVAAIEPRYPDPAAQRPLVVHAPTAPVCKGTPYVLAAVERLHAEGLQFDFTLIDNMPHDEAQALVALADVVIDQVILGDFGVLALEAMAYGKPVVAWVKPSMASLYPPDLPVVSADPEGVAGALRTLLTDGSLRARLGREGRAYVEREHTPSAIARRLMGAYACAQRLREGGER
jgi:hypothetical protein